MRAVNVWDGPFRRFGPLAAEDAGFGYRCPACGEPTVVGDYVTLAALETPKEAGSRNVRAVVVHGDCRRKLREA